MGRTNPFITEHILSHYDAYTVSFGDNRRYYMRGQLTIFKNNNVTNNLWKKCTDLSHIGKRLKAFFDHPNAAKRMNGWRFESAEGCISTIVAAEPHLRSLSTNVLISDAFRASTEEKETLMLNSAAIRCYGAPIGNLSTEGLSSLLSREWYDTVHEPYQNYLIRSRFLQDIRSTHLE